MDLALIRQVVQAAVAEALAQVTISREAAATTADSTTEFELAPDEFGDNLLLG